MPDAIGGDLASARELILGFDAGCSTCSGIATRIEERVGDKLVIRNLRDPELMQWRREALGESAPWAPTLFQVEGDKVQAWVGMKMGLALSRRLGPKDTWRVMQVLGEMGEAARIQGSRFVVRLPGEAQEAVTGISRGQFLKGMGGVAVAATVLAGGALSSPAQAATTSSPFDIVRTRILSGTALSSAVNRAKSSVDTKAVAGTALQWTSGKYKSVEYTYRNGIIATAVVLNRPDGSRFTYAFYSRPLAGGRATSCAKLWRPSNGKYVVVRGSEGGRLWRNPDPISSRSARSGGVAPLSECPSGTSTQPSKQCFIEERRECVEYASPTNSTPECNAEVIVGAAGCATAVGAIGALVAIPSAGVGTVLVAAGGTLVCGAGLYLAQQGCCIRYKVVQIPVPC
jgi:hypothetical protein